MAGRDKIKERAQKAKRLLGRGMARQAANAATKRNAKIKEIEKALFGK